MPPEAQALAAGFEVLLLDLDGTVYAGGEVLPGAVDALRESRARGLALRFVTNNASRPPEDVAAHLERRGIAATVEEVRNSSQAGAQLVRERCGEGARVLAIGGPGVPAALREHGLVPLTSADDDPAAVLQGLGPDVGWAELTEAAFAVRAGALWVATNVDPVLPHERGLAVGNGSLVAAVRSATGAEPLVAGKPEPTLMTAAADGRRALAVGDRLGTDIRGARAAGIPSLFVLTGVDDPESVLRAVPEERPEHLGADLRALLDEPVPVHRDGDVWRCRDAAVRLADGVVEPADDGGGDPLDLLRAGCAACWSGDDAAPGAALLARVRGLHGR